MTNKYTLEHSEANICVMDRLDNGAIDPDTEERVTGLTGFMFLLCPMELTYIM